MEQELVKIEEADRRIEEFKTPEEGVALQKILQDIVGALKRREVSYLETFKWEDRVRKTERKVGNLFSALPILSGKYQTEHAVKFDKTKTEIIEGFGVFISGAIGLRYLFRKLSGSAWQGRQEPRSVCRQANAEGAPGVVAGARLSQRAAIPDKRRDAD
jgi:hypothetical protein